MSAGPRRTVVARSTVSMTAAEAHTPAGTYRLQVRPGCGLAAVSELADYLARLGVSHVYASPLLQPSPGRSTATTWSTPPWSTPTGRRGGLPPAGGAAARAGPRHGPGHRAEPRRPAHRRQPVVVGRAAPRPRARHRRPLRHRLGRPRRRRMLSSPSWATTSTRSSTISSSSPTDGGPASPTTSTPGPPRLARGAGVDPDDGRPISTAAGPAGRQHYDLAHWRAGSPTSTTAASSTSPPRGPAIEDPAVRDCVLGRSPAVVTDGAADGLRIDHPDGMWDPGGTFAASARTHPTPGWSREDPRARRTGRGAGRSTATVGYELRQPGAGPAVDPRAEEPAGPLSPRSPTSRPTHDGSAAGQAPGRRHLLVGPSSAAHPAAGRGPARTSCWPATERGRAALLEALVAFPVTAPTCGAQRVEVTATGRGRRGRRPGPGRPGPTTRRARTCSRPLVLERRGPAADELATRFQQVTGPAMAKGVEDTAFYRDVRFAALNEVGGDPARFGDPPAASTPPTAPARGSGRPRC